MNLYNFFVSVSWSEPFPTFRMAAILKIGKKQYLNTFFLVALYQVLIVSVSSLNRYKKLCISANVCVCCMKGTNFNILHSGHIENWPKSIFRTFFLVVLYQILIVYVSRLNRYTKLCISAKVCVCFMKRTIFNISHGGHFEILSKTIFKHIFFKWICIRFY